MHTSLRSAVSILLLAAPISALAQLQQQQLKPNEIATNLPGATTTVAPPAGFNPLTASDQDLEEFGFPPRPNEISAPEGYATWKSAMASSVNRISPVLQQTNIFHGPAKVKGAAASAKLDNGTAGSYNWSGYVNTSGASNYTATSFYFVESDFVVPIAEQAFGACTGSWDYSSSWVGIDGWGSSDVLQAGTESDALCSGGYNYTYYSPWFEWYPLGETRISNLPIAPGQVYFVEVWSTSSTAGHAYLVNKTTNQYVIVNFSAPAGTTLKGNSAEWVAERPGLSTGLATLTNYVAEPFWGSTSYNFNYTGYYPGSSSSTAITMYDNNGNPISYPTLLGTTSFLMQDEGSAF